MATVWGFDCTKDNPYNDFDGGHKDWNVVFPGVDKLTPTISWELCREGVDDCRYVATLQQKIGEAKARGQTAAAERAERILRPLLDPEAPGIECLLAFSRHRWRIAREILALRQNRKEAELAKTSFLFIDDLSLQAIEEPPLSISTPLEEYNIGEKVHWKLSAAPDSRPLEIQFLMGNRVVSEHSAQPKAGLVEGEFETAGLKPGICILRAAGEFGVEAQQVPQQQIILAPNRSINPHCHDEKRIVSNSSTVPERSQACAERVSQRSSPFDLCSSSAFPAVWCAHLDHRLRPRHRVFLHGRTIR